MERESKRLGRRGRRGVITVAAAAVSMGTSLAAADTLTWDTADTAGIQTGAATWDLNTTANWTPSGGDGTSRVAWTNGNSAEFRMPGGGITVTVDEAAGQISLSSLLLSGPGGSNTLNLNATGGATLQLGAGGIVGTMSSQIVSIGAPLVLTASQTWTSTNVRTNTNGAGLKMVGGVSSLAGTTNLIFDGMGISDPYGQGNSNTRVAILLGGENTFSGTTTVTGGAALWLDYTANNGNRLDDSSALILSGGSIVMNNGTNVVETVASTTIDAGANTIYKAGNAGAAVNRLAMGALTRNVGGTLDVTTAVSGIASTTTLNTGGILGGWATMGGTRWAKGSADGSATLITNTAGSSRSTSASWGTTENVSMTASESGIAGRTVNALLLNGTNIALGLASGATLTLTSGGLLAASTGQSITGGSITTNAVTSGTGELFVHTPNSFTLGSVIANNGATPTSLVKAGASTLILTAANSYTGRTYVNSGTVTLDNGGSLATANITIEAGSLNAGTTGSGGTINYTISNNTTDLITIDGGILDLTNLKLNLVVSGTQTQTEYVLADKAVGSAFVLGTQFASVTNLGTWSIDYNGTAANPDSIVIMVPEPAGMSIAGLMATGLLVRRRKLNKRSLS